MPDIDITVNARMLNFFWLTASPQSARSQTPFRICYDPRTLTIPHMSPYVSPPPPEPQVFWQSAIPSEAPFNSRLPRFQHQINGQIIFSRWNRPLRIPPTLIPPRSLPQIRASYNVRSCSTSPFLLPSGNRPIMPSPTMRFPSVGFQVLSSLIHLLGAWLFLRRSNAIERLNNRNRCIRFL